MPVSSVHSLSRRGRAALALPAVALAVVSVAGCGGGSTSKHAAAAGSAAATSAPAAAAGSAPAGGATPAAGGANGFTAYLACLKSHGVAVPTGRVGARPSGGTGARPSRAAGASGRPGGGGGFGALLSTTGPDAVAAKACASLRPTGGFGGGSLSNNAQLQSELTAYRSCLSDHGVILPTQAARPSGAAAGATPGARRAGGGLGIGALNTADPKTAAAVKACAPLRPTFGGAGGAAGAGAGATPAPAVTPSS